MRKLAVFLILLVIFSLVLTIVGLVIPSVGKSLHFIFVKTIGEGLATILSGAASAALLWASGFGLIGFGIIVLPSIVIGILIAGTVHQLWQKRPTLLGGQKTASAQKQMTMQREPAEPEPPQKTEKLIPATPEKE